MTTIYVSYRSDDISATGESVVQALARRYGAANLIVDIPAMASDAEYMAALDHAIKHADIVLALIGTRWLRAPDATGQPKLESATDIVRFELATALHRRKPLLMLLSDGAVSPAAAELPTEIAALAQQPAYPIAADHLTSDLDRVVRDIDTHWQRTQQRQVNALALIVGVAIALMLFLPFYPLAIIVFLLTVAWGNVLATRARQTRWRAAMFAPLIVALGVVVVNFRAFGDPYRQLGFIVPGLLLCVGAEIGVLLPYALRSLNTASSAVSVIE